MANEVAMTIQVPTELSTLGKAVQGIVSDLAAGKNWMTVLSGVLPVLFAEGAQIEEIKAELKDPQVYALAGVLLGGVVAAYLVKKAAAASPVAPVV